MFWHTILQHTISYVKTYDIVCPHRYYTILYVRHTISYVGKNPDVFSLRRELVWTLKPNKLANKGTIAALRFIVYLRRVHSISSFSFNTTAYCLILQFHLIEYYSILPNLVILLLHFIQYYLILPNTTLWFNSINITTQYYISTTSILPNTTERPISVNDMSILQSSV